MSEAELLPGWKRQPLRNVVDQFIVPMRDKPLHWSGDIPWCRIEDFDGKYLYGSKSDQRVDRKTIRLMNLKVFPVGTVLCSCSATLGVCTITARELVSNQTFIGLLPGDSIDTEFLYYKMTSHAKDLQGMSSGTTIAYLPRSRFEEFEIDLPTKPEQKRIAEILSTIDEAIEQTEALIAKTQQIKAGLMHDLFTRGVTPDGQLRPPREEAPQLYKESPLGWIPKEWDSGRLKSRGIAGRPHIKTGPFGSSLKLEHWVDHGVPVITIGSLGEGEFIESELLHVSERTATRLNDYRLKEGDIVFSRVADVGRSAVIETDQLGWVMSSNLMRISLDPTLADAHFLQAQLAYSSSIPGQIRATVNAGGREVANSETLNRLRFAWPEKDEQERIVQFMSLLNFPQTSENQYLSKLFLYKRGLAGDLLSGRIAA